LNEIRERKAIADRLEYYWASQSDEGKKPGYFINWAISKRHRPDWLDWALSERHRPDWRDWAIKQDLDLDKLCARSTENIEGKKASLLSDDWKEQARTIADECFDSDTASICRDSLKGYSRRVMEEMQKREIHGPRGRIDNLNTIMRDALQGKKWWADKSK
jgi:hypothetical protein